MRWSRVSLICLGILLAVAIVSTAQTITTGQAGFPDQSNVVNLAALPPITDAWSIAPATPTNFFAVGDNGTQDPPFPGGAVGTNYIVSTLDHVIRVQTRSGTTLYTVAITNFWEGLGPYTTTRQVFDPKVVYDPYNDRWMMTAVSDFAMPRSSILVAVTKNGDPTGDWNLYRVGVDPAHALCANYPSIAFNKKWIVVCAEMRTNASPYATTSAQVYAFDKTNLYANGSGSFTKFITGQFASDAPFIQEPAVTYDNTLDRLYLLNSWNGSQGTLGLFHIEGAIGSEVFVSHPLLHTAYTWDQGAPGTGAFAPQLGTSEEILLDDARMQGLIYRNGSLWAAHTVFVPAGGNPTRGAIQWYQITTNGVFLQKGRLEDQTNQRFYGYPSIAVNQLNDAVIGFARFSASNYASAYFSIHTHSDPTNTFQADNLLKAGDAPFERSVPPLRWGDHTSTVVDPVNDLDFWTIQEYATSTNVSPTSRWGTWWGKVQTTSPVDLSLTKTSSPNPAIIGSNLTYTINVTNRTAAIAPSVTVTDVLPAGVTFISATTSQGTCTNIAGTVTCSLSLLSNNAAASVQIVVVPGSGASLTNVATVTTSVTDSNLTNNAATNIVTVLAPAQLVVAPASRDFGVVTVGSTSNQAFSVINTGDLTLTGTATVSSPFSVTNVGPFNVEGHGTGAVVIAFSPGSAGSFSDAVVFSSNGGVSTNPVTGASVTPAQLDVSPASFNFGTVATGTTAQTSFVVTNKGGAVLNGSATLAVGAFSIADGSPFNFNVPGFASTNLTVNFTPPSSGLLNANLISTSNGGNATNALAGTGAILPSASFTGTPTNGLAPLVVTFTNASAGTITNIFWNFGDGANSNTLAATVQHTYNVPGTNTVTLIASGPLGVSTNMRPNYIVVTNIPPHLVVTPVSRDFGLVPVGQTSEQTFSVINSGLDALIGSATISGSPFSLTNAAFNLSGGQTGTVNVTYSPTSVGVDTGAVFFASNGGVSTNTVTGSSAALPVADFTGAPTNGLVPLAVTFTNSSSGTITNVFWDFGDGANSNTLAATVLHTYNLPGTNTVTLIASGPVGVSTNTHANYIVARLAAADLELTKTAGSNFVAQGQSLNYTLSVTNRGSDTAASVTITDTLPAGLSFVSATTSQGTCTNLGGTVVCDLAALPVGTNVVINILTMPSIVGTLTNQAVAFTPTADPNLSNNTGTVAVTVLATADLAMTQTAAPNPVLTSQNVTYTLTVTNLGPSAASSVTVTDALPAGFSFISASASQGTCTNVGGVVTCSLGIVGLDSNVTAQITAIPAASDNVTNISNTALVIASEFDPVLSNNTSVASLVVYLDADSDGIPDYWTEQFFGHGTGQAADNSRAQDDADGDGFSNLQEYLAGTSPVDANSALRIVAISSVDTNVLISFTSITNKLYRLESSDGPIGPWTNIVADDIEGNGGTNQVTDIVAPETPVRFYRIRLLP